MTRVRQTLSTLVLLALAGAFIPSAPAWADHTAVGFGSGVSGPIVTIAAHTLHQGMWGLSFRLEYIDFDALSDSDLVRLAPGAGEVHSIKNVVSPSLSVAYGVSRTVTVSARLPAVSRHDIRGAQVNPDLSIDVHHHGNSGGIGDMTLLGQWGIVTRGNSKLALLTGIKVPTGQTHVESDGERFETEHQPGSGSWDFLEGIASSTVVSFGSVDASLLASFPTKGAQETNLGTLFNYNVAISGPLLGGAGHHHHDAAEESRPHRHREKVGADFILELNGEARSHMEIAREKDRNSGGNLVYLSPGFRLGPPESWSVSASVGAPIIQDLNGTQHKTELRVLLGFATGF